MKTSTQMITDGYPDETSRNLIEAARRRVAEWKPRYRQLGRNWTQFHSEPVTLTVGDVGIKQTITSAAGLDLQEDLIFNNTEEALHGNPVLGALREGLLGTD